MKKGLLKTTLFTLLATLTLGSAGCGGSETSNVYTGTKLPDYSASSKEFEFFAYRTMTDGSYTYDGVTYTPAEEYKENFLTDKAMQTYKEAGFTRMYVNAGFTGGEWEGSETQKVMKLASNAGYDEIIIKDSRIMSLINYSKEDLLKLYNDEAGVQAYVKECLQSYYQEPGFFGLSLTDEPKYTQAESYGITYKAVRAAAAELGIENIYLHMNLLPIDHGGIGSGRFQREDAEGNALTFEQSYRQYVTDFMRETGADRLSVDIYFFRAAGVYPGTYANLQILREVCDEFGADLTFCLQSFEMWNGQSENYSKMDKTMMRMEIESLIGMGVDTFAYYTYNPDQTSYSDGVKTLDGGNFLDFNGEPTEIYYFAQKVMEEVKSFQNVVLNYEFKGSNLYTAPVATFNNAPYLTSSTCTSSNTVIEYEKGYQFALIKDFEKDFTCDNDVAFVTELYDEENDLYMYMVQNVIDPRNGKNGNTAENVTVNFGSEYKYIAEFDGGNLTYHNLDNGVYKRALSAGQAVYLVPLK